MLSTRDGPFIQVGRLNLPKYVQNQAIARALFEHLFHHANDIRTVRMNYNTKLHHFFFIIGSSISYTSK